eukprot:TRINITY_DN6650_c0_g1_i1.p1 TRINITY_DN6650_c0_g1~~TRINITY_DN6650_c0_g1_i1.p1  ORF type:complete len:446 (+),score=89.08 TRINITY_DN6650_c0_g1_i1:123-1460(+)
MALSRCCECSLKWLNGPRKMQVRSLQTIHQLTSIKKTSSSRPESQRDRHISVSQRDLIHTLLTKSKRLKPADQTNMARFAAVLSTVTSAQLQGIWRELKHFYEPLDPDRDTVHVNKISRNERIAYEKRFLELFEKVIDDANFEVLPKGDMLSQLSTKVSAEGVKVSVDQSKYSFIRMWTRGKARQAPTAWSERASKLLRTLRGEPDVNELHRIYPRCLMACKINDQLSLKMFKNVEDNRLELLLPEIKIAMSNFDRNLLLGTIGVTGLGMMWRLTTQAHDKLALGTLQSIGAAMLATGVLVGVNLYNGVNNNQHRYLSKYHRTLYYQNVASNRSVLALLVDRATEEEFAETLLAYYVLATNPGPLTYQGLAIVVEDLLQQHFGLNIQFDVYDAVAKLDQLKLVSTRGLHAYFSTEAISVVPLEEALKRLATITTDEIRKSELSVP